MDALNKEFWDFKMDILLRHKWLVPERHSKVTKKDVKAHKRLHWGIEQAIYNLFLECSSESKKKLVKKLLENFQVVHNVEVPTYISEIADKICNIWKLQKHNTQIVGTAERANQIDSSHFMGYMILPELIKMGWGQPSIIPQHGLSHDNLKKYPVVVFLDEFSGTGNTVVNRITCLENSKYGNKIERVYVCLLAAMKEAIDHIKDVKPNVEIYTCLTLKKGISDGFSGKALRLATADMQDLEGKLGNEKNTTVPSFGHGKAETLFFREAGHIPNSVFPIFWWNTGDKGGKRIPLFERKDPYPDKPKRKKNNG